MESFMACFNLAKTIKKCLKRVVQLMPLRQREDKCHSIASIRFHFDGISLASHPAEHEPKGHREQRDSVANQTLHWLAGWLACNVPNQETEQESRNEHGGSHDERTEQAHGLSNSPRVKKVCIQTHQTRRRTRSSAVSVLSTSPCSSQPFLAAMTP